MKEQNSHGLHKLSSTTLSIAALGVVFGDTGTRPIYTLKDCFRPHHIPATHEHIFGAGPILRGWFSNVFPALALNYLGQGALLMHQPELANAPFFQMAPSWTTLPLVLLTTAASKIAQQPATYFQIPVGRVIELGQQVEI